MQDSGEGALWIDHRDVERLIHTYAELVDAGDFEGVGRLLEHAAFIGADEPERGRELIAANFARAVLRYEDGTPRTRHLITNVVIEVAGDRAQAEARSSFTALQGFPREAVDVVASGRYLDRFERVDGVWRFTERRVQVLLAGDLSRHIAG